MKTVSLIIPFFDEYKELQLILDSIPEWSLIPNEIIIVNTDNFDKNKIIKVYKNKFTELDIELLILEREGAYPGCARNHGIKSANYELIAFLDAKTLPDKEWLESGVKQLNENEVGISFGKTKYQATSILEKNIRSSTYGRNPLRTLPGSVIKKDVFNHVGTFVEHVRAGEDGDWLSRIKLHKKVYKENQKLLNYSGLKNIQIITLFKKWYRNYLSSTQLPHLKAHKDIYFYFMGFLLLLLAFNWNNLSYDPNISGWNTKSIFYIPNITKTIFAILMIIYFFIRAIFLPLKKGVGLSDIFPVNFVIIFIISIILDLIKITAFLFGRCRNILIRLREATFFS